ncbi:MAG: hypothetical protein M1827_005429 [Pycnora praestabilis]|nr:MAG: hypothetical protein M1827_005429 [Pycnora praestabilis]
MDSPSARKIADATAKEGAPHRRAVIGNESNFWRHSTKDGFDLTHPASQHSPLPKGAVHIKTTTTAITVDPAKTALVIVDMQNFFLSPSLGRGSDGAGHKASDALLEHAIPAARKAGIQIIWLNWGLTDKDVEEMPPAVKRAFGFESSTDEGDSKPINKHGVDEMGNHWTENGKDSRIYKGIGASIGRVELEDGSVVEGGGLLMRDTWNVALHPPLDKAYQEGLKLEKPHKADVWIHKDRMSGLWGARTLLQDYLDEHGIRSLLFTGVNTDQCVGGTLQDAFSKGYDCILLSDGCGTTSPKSAQDCIEFNGAKTWGFVASCGDLALGVDAMSSE